MASPFAEQAVDVTADRLFAPGLTLELGEGPEGGGPHGTVSNPSWRKWPSTAAARGMARRRMRTKLVQSVKL